MTDSIQIQKSEYDAILRQTVAVIDKALAKEYASPLVYALIMNQHTMPKC